MKKIWVLHLRLFQTAHIYFPKTIISKWSIRLTRILLTFKNRIIHNSKIFKQKYKAKWPSAHKIFKLFLKQKNFHKMYKSLNNLKKSLLKCIVQSKAMKIKHWHLQTKIWQKMEIINNYNKKKWWRLKKEIKNKIKKNLKLIWTN